LPETVNTDSINATYENGILHVALPKKEEALPKPKRLIEIG
jgi:HSP20 family protein